MVFLCGHKNCLLGFLCPKSLCLTMENVLLCPQQVQDKNQSPEFLLHIKFQSFGAHRWQLNSLGPHPGCLAHSHCNPFQAPSWSLCVELTWPWATRLLGPHGHVLPGERVCEQRVSASPGRGQEREKTSLFFVSYISLGLDGPGALSKEPTNFQGFCRL